MITQTYTLDLIPHGEPLIVHASQYDTESRTLVFNLVKEGIAFDATGMSASIRGTKPDNTGFMYAMVVDGTSVSIDIKDQMTALPGNVPCEVLIADSSGSLGTANFTLRVEKSALDDETVISETDIPVFEELVTQASEYASQASSSASTAQSVLEDVIYATETSESISLQNNDADTLEGLTWAEGLASVESEISAKQNALLIESKSISYTISANGDWSTSTVFTKNGYTLVGIVGAATNNANVYVANQIPNNAYGLYLKNLSSNSVTQTAVLYLLWQKN